MHVTLRGVVAVATLALSHPALAQSAAQTGESSVLTRGVEVVRAKPPAPRTCPRPFARTDLTLQPGTRAAGFDRALRSRLAARPARVLIDLAAPFPLGTAGPAQLAPWFGELRARDGIVSVDQYCEAARGLFSWLKKVFSPNARSGYAAIDGYDAVLHADGLAQTVTQIEFRLRGSPAQP